MQENNIQLKEYELDENELKDYNPKLFSDLINFPLLATIYTTLTMLAIFVAIEGIWHNTNLSKNFDLISYILSVLPVIPLIFIWLNQKRQQWQNSIANYLTVTFTYEAPHKTDEQPLDSLQLGPKTQIKASYIPLTDIADIRSQSQTIGKSINGENLDIAPVLDIKPDTKIKIDTRDPHKHKCLNNGQPFELHEVTIKMKTPLKKHKIFKNHALKDDDIICWTYPFSESELLVKRGAEKIKLSELKHHTGEPI